MQFICRLGTPDGRIVEQQHQGDDEPSLRRELERRGYHVFDIHRPGLLSKLSAGRMQRGPKKIPHEKFLIFNQELAALLRAGLPLLQALDLMLERMKDPQLRPVMDDIRNRVRSGEAMSEAFSAYGDMFPRLYSSSLKAGERSGDLEGMLRRFIRYLHLVTTARKKIVSALAYPTVLIFLSIAMMTVMGLVVVPKFRGFYQDVGADLPLITEVLMGVAGFAQDQWILLTVGLIVGYLLFQQWVQTPTGRETLDRFKLRIPLVGSILHRFGLSEFCRSLATLLSGGIPLVSAADIAVGGVGNAYIRKRLEPTIQLVREGRPFHETLEASDVFTDMAIDMVKVGEATGALDEMLSNVSDFLDDQVETRTQRLLSLVEPILLVFMGLVIAVLLISIYLPMFSLMTQIQ
ncbi:MAG: type II secretion system F family protein [Acidobacteriota bacterium]